MNVWHSFQGCVIAVMPFTVSILSGIATYKFLRQLAIDQFITVWATVVIAACVFMLAVILKNNIGGNNGQK